MSRSELVDVVKDVNESFDHFKKSADQRQAELLDRIEQLESERDRPKGTWSGGGGKYGRDQREQGRRGEHPPWVIDRQAPERHEHAVDQHRLEPPAPRSGAMVAAAKTAAPIRARGSELDGPQPVRWPTH